MKPLLVRRTVTTTISGEKDVVDDLATKLTIAAAEALKDAPHPPAVRTIFEHKVDFLDDDWNVIPAAEIVAAALRLRDAERVADATPARRETGTEP